MNTNNWARYVLGVAELTLWASDVLADEAIATDIEVTRSAATVALGCPEFEPLHPWAARVLESDAQAASGPSNRLAADLVISQKVLLLRQRPLFTEPNPGVLPGGDVGGDVQTGDSHMRRFAAQLDGCHWAVVDVYTYLGTADVMGNGGPVLWRQDEYTICTDPSRPGDTEVMASSSTFDTGTPAPCEDDAYDYCADLPLAAVMWSAALEECWTPRGRQATIESDTDAAG
ncbi:hypothetical protein [Amycolatopsis sp. NPDC021455]|uniref:hypothetical protein n=1 Tax=Amycolatopsis sp. NPDC021455 TaxID=3154901 RepID=UPI0033F9FCD9